MAKTRELVLSVRQSDCVMDVFRAGGKGGQAQNKTNSGVRFRHLPSGAVGESREHRSQHQNKLAAWRRMAESREMQSWLKIRAGEAVLSAAEKADRERQIARRVDKAMTPESIQVEVKDDRGRWTLAPDLEEGSGDGDA